MMTMISNRLPVLALQLGAAAAVIIGTAAAVAAFAPPSSPCSTSTSTSTWTSTSFRNNEQHQQQFGIINVNTNYGYNERCIGHGGGSSIRRSTELYSFMGSDGGILGIGTPELFTILLVGYFVLGPSDLYKLVKEVGKFVQNFRTFTADATANLENTFESQLQLEEIRKAQRELNDAFSFRRSINVDADTDPFEVNVQTPRSDGYDLDLDGSSSSSSIASEMSATAAAADGTTAAAVATAPKKKIRRRVKKKKVVAAPTEGEGGSDTDNLDFSGANTATDTALPDLANNVPDLNLDDEDDLELAQAQQRAEESMRLAQEELRKEKEEEEERERIRTERMERLQGGQPSSSSSEMNGSRIEEEKKDPQVAVAEQSRFQQQLSGTWNDQILDKGDDLAPLANIMERLALLEDEKAAADKRLQEEFNLREENEERYYREKRALLEEAAAKVQADAYDLAEK